MSRFHGSDPYADMNDQYDEKYDLVHILKDNKTWILDVVHHDFYEYLPRISRFDQDLCDQDPPLPREEIEANLE